MATFESVDAVAALLRESRPGLVAIAGQPGAGKSTLASALVRSIHGSVLLPMDGYHLPQSRLVELGRRDRMGAPDTFDVDAFRLTLRHLVVSGGPVFAPDFDRDVEEPAPGAIVIRPTQRPVIVEGNYLLLWDDLRFDVTLYLDVDERVRRSRLIERHMRFGKSAEAARDWALGSDEANALVIRQTAGRADHVIRLA
jgi:pantothenate kinase